MLRTIALMASALLLLVGAPVASAQSQPVQVSISGNTATAIVGSPVQPLAEVILQFEEPVGLSASSLGISASLVSLTDPVLLARLPSAQLNQLSNAFPLLVTVEPPLAGGLKFRTVRVEVHTHALVYSIGSSYRLFKAPLNGAFQDITDEVAPGSVRARGTTGGFSQFLVLTDLRETGAVVIDKLAALRAKVDALPSAEKAGFDALLDDIEADLAADDFAGAIAGTQAVAQRARTRATAGAITGQWRATRDVTNQAGELVAASATLAFSIGYQRDFGQ